MISLYGLNETQMREIKRVVEITDAIEEIKERVSDRRGEEEIKKYSYETFKNAAEYYLTKVGYQDCNEIIRDDIIDMYFK